MKVLALLLIFLLRNGIPGVELVFLFFAIFMPLLKIELEMAVNEAGRDLRNLENRYQKFLSSCAPCAKNMLLEEIKFEIAACKSQIRRIRKSGLVDEAHQRMLVIDLKELEQFQQQRRDLLAFNEQELQETYLVFLEEGVDDATVQFLRLAREYDPLHSPPTEDPWAIQGETCNVCTVPIFGLGIITK